MKTYDELKALITRRGVHEVFGNYGEGWGIEQNAEELAAFLVEMQALGIESVLEVGTGWRAGLARFLHDDMGWEVVSVDIHDYGHHHDGITFETSDGVELPVFQQQFDLVIIDGDHSYEGVLRDHDYYGGYAAKVIAFHDTAGLRDCEGVKQYWGEIAYVGDTLKRGYHEIAAEGDIRGGIGYVVLVEAVGTDPEQAIRAGLEDIKAGRVHEIAEAADLLQKDAAAKKPVPAPRKPPAKRPPAKKTAAKK